MRPLPLLTALSLLLLPSCAYMQTHRNVREQGRVFPGYQLSKPDRVYRSGSSWFLAAAPATFRREYDPIHDPVLLQTGEPVMSLLQADANAPAFHPISPHTATVLLRADGYADTGSLCRELSQSPEAWRSSLPHASAHPVKALVAGEETLPVTLSPSPENPPFAYRFLSGVDLVFVDVPGTLVYNLAVPFIAPFKFFRDFLAN